MNFKIRLALVIIPTLLVFQEVKAQKDTLLYQFENKTYSFTNRNYQILSDTTEKLDILPSYTYKGKRDQFIRFLVQTVRYPAADYRNRTTGRVQLVFIVEEDGSITNLKILKSVSEGIDAEALRVIQLSSPWVPAMLRGKPVKVIYTVPINFELGN